MTLNLKISPEFEQSLRQQYGDGLEREALEGVAIKWFNAGYISSRQVAKMLGLSWYETESFLKQNGGLLNMTIDEVRQEAASILDNQ